jgi:ferric-chelate reductase
MYMYKDSHELHVYCGWTILIFSTSHSVFHIVRWALQGNLYLLFAHFTGLSGLFIIASCILICIPMTIFRTQIRYEIRKNLHFLFIVFAAALMFHTPTSAIPNGGFTSWVFGIIIAWYCADSTYCYFFMTEKIDTTKFSVVPCGVRMTMAVSERFQKMGDQGGICYVCLPWIDKNQWHAFSLFEDPANPEVRQIFIQKTGDWTTQVHRVLQRDTVRPAWIHGPFPSPYDNAISYDNQILVASGIGITPALSVIRAHKDTRRINLVWAVRDEALLEFFLNHLYLDHDGWNIIFYTGKKQLRDECIHLKANTNVCILSGRPRLNELIPNIIYGIESGLGLPENYTPGTKQAASNLLANQLLASGDGSDSSEVFENLAIRASELGYRLPTEAVLHQELNTGTLRSSTAQRRASAQIMEHLSMDFRPWKYHEGASKFVKGLDKKLVLPTWGMIYCGGAKPVLKALEEISDEYEIGLHVESFAW